MRDLRFCCVFMCDTLHDSLLCIMSESEQKEGTSQNEAVLMLKYDDPYAESPTRFCSLSAIEATRNDTEPSILSSSLTDSVTSDGKLCPALNGKESPGHISEFSGGTAPELNGEGGNDNTDSASTTDVVPSSQTEVDTSCLLYTSPSPRDRTRSRMPSSA